MMSTIERTVTTRNASVPSATDDIASWTKAELYERAQERDIDGRSGMTQGRADRQRCRKR